ncbi:hypothetical protein GCM10027343_20920 [Noviherbaspirillum agri]
MQEGKSLKKTNCYEQMLKEAGEVRDHAAMHAGTAQPPAEAGEEAVHFTHPTEVFEKHAGNIGGKPVYGSQLSRLATPDPENPMHLNTPICARTSRQSRGTEARP